MKRSFLMVVAMGAWVAAVDALAEEAKTVNAMEIVSTVCAMCHGDDGNKMLTPETPKIGGQREDYLAKALQDYKNGSRNNPIMAAVAQPLSDAEIKALSQHFAAQVSELYTKK